jgi:hypothetical protein
MGFSAGKAGEEIDPLGTELRLDVELYRDHPARLNRRDKVGANVSEALRRHANGDGVDGA